MVLFFESSCSLSIIILGFFTTIVSSEAESFTSSETIRNAYNDQSNCYAMAVYDELMRAIEILKENTVKQDDISERRPPPVPSRKKLQEDEDDGGGGGGGGDLEIPSIVPMIFRVVGSALSLNSSAIVESSQGIIPERLSNQITSVLTSLASTILGSSVIPKTTRPPPPRRRRRTTTISPSTSIPTTSVPPPSTTPELTTEKGPTTTEMLFKESSLGELPVYASAYAPNYVATTPYPIYASSYLHVLFAAPTTTTVPTTTTTTESPSTTADPNSYAVALPFDYQDMTSTTINIAPFLAGFLNGTGTTSGTDYEEYEYEGAMEENKVKSEAGV